MIDVLNYIPEGYENRITRFQLVNKIRLINNRLKDRNVREMISQKRRDVIILNLDGGYFIPTLPEENHLVIRWCDQETRRAKSIFWSMNSASEYVKELV